MAGAPKLALSRMSVGEFLDWPGDGAGTKYELVDGEPRTMAPASATHGTMQITIGSLLRAHLMMQRPGCRVVAEAGIVPRVRSAANMRVPDLAVSCVADAPGQRALPDPVVIIEILSPSNEAETRENVWAYASIPSVREILLVRSTEIAAELLVRQIDGTWPAQPLLLGAGDAVVIDSIAYRGPLDSFYVDTHLNPNAGG